MNDRPSEKKKYERPTLRVYGTVLDLTQNSANAGTLNDTVTGSKKSF